MVSSIIHIDHEYYDADKEPWPIEIEDHDGVLHQLLLEPGQVSDCSCVKYVGALGVRTTAMR